MPEIVTMLGGTTTVVKPRSTLPVVVIGGTTTPVEITTGTMGPAGPPGDDGPMGPPGGPTVIAVPYADWPPATPQPDTLYLRLAP